MTHERIAIIGTANSWTRTPWNDPGLYLVSLNDAYRLNGFKRADAWYDIHPVDKFWTVPEGTAQVYAHQVPPGHYVRPKEHRDWLKAQAIPVWLNPDYLTQWPDAVNWPSARPFPREDVRTVFGRYFASSPALMMAHAILQGVKELHIYGIHLATEHEYIEQRPNFEFLCGRLLGPSKLTITEKQGLRYFETSDALIVLPEASPILSAEWEYGFEARPRAGFEGLKWESHKVQIKRERAVAQLKTAPWWKSTKPIQDELWRLDAWQLDIQDQLQHASMER